MPELPEVEVTRRGITPGIIGRRIDAVAIRHTGLRRAVPATLAESLAGLQIETVDRRGKFILIRCVARGDRPEMNDGGRTARGGTFLSISA